MPTAGKTKIWALDIAFVVISVVFLVGVLTVFGPCGPKDDGSWMTCHWAGMAVAGIAAVLLALSVIHLVVRDANIKVGIDIAVFPLAIFAALTPGTLIGLCMMNTMQCHALMRPAVILISILVAVVAAVDIAHQRSAGLPKRSL